MNPDPELHGTDRLAHRNGEDLMRGSRKRGFRASNAKHMEAARDKVLARRATLRRRYS